MPGTGGYWWRISVPRADRGGGRAGALGQFPRCSESRPLLGLRSPRSAIWGGLALVGGDRAEFYSGQYVVSDAFALRLGREGLERSEHRVCARQGRVENVM